ncbi:tripartite tricarboxylate transporter TctB family protein [Nitratireductor sp. ZSWI3]|uniref:tripartite tricarboxylate transporter TctB family protein n=1 Tax=Nitratireductor sp. ZSWI3 TaxID=2966359 RepID=UPI00214FD8D6|nr:tripartite tricarboxylate transporter TctB family protein [Nitratireductor sp. ZSWI3]MCR4265163.1 tripartite tricarboxylate transporter TctB family protein [Nitratireductor sp. ZSWI3]
MIELAGCVGLFAIFVRYFQAARMLPQPLNQIDIGAGGFPLLLAASTLIAIAAVAVAALIRAFGTMPESWVSVRRPVWVAIAAVLLVAQSIYFEKIGALPSVVIFSLATMLACGERRISQLIGVPLALVAFIWAAFILALSVNLP